MTSVSITQQIHRYLVSRIGLIFEEMSVKSGLEIPYNKRNVEHICSYIEQYMMFDQLPDSGVDNLYD